MCRQSIPVILWPLSGDWDMCMVMGQVSSFLLIKSVGFLLGLSVTSSPKVF